MKTFEQKVKSMKASEVIAAMIKGLEKPRVEIDMYTFGEEVDGVCFGCAATNAILVIAKKKDFKWGIDTATQRSKSVNSDRDFMYNFEAAINALRMGSIAEYNFRAKQLDFIPIKSEMHLPELTTLNYKSELYAYKILLENEIKLETAETV